jgi:hypothetical protein
LTNIHSAVLDNGGIRDEALPSTRSCSCVASFNPVTAGATLGPQTEEGSILLPGPGPNGETTGGCWTGWARRFWIFSNGSTAGPFGSIFAIDKKTWGGKFKLETTGGSYGSEDLDMTFYADPGQIDPADPAQQGGIVETGAYLSREPGGEVGTVPARSEIVLICLAIGSGFNAGWKYTATPAKK